MTPFSSFLEEHIELSSLRRAIAEAKRRPETDCVAALIDEATLAPELSAQATKTARFLASQQRKRAGSSGVEAIMQRFSLSSPEGLALMRLAEAILRIPDAATKDALIRDQVGDNDWQSFVGREQPLTVNAAALAMTAAARLHRDPTGLLARGSAPFIRLGIERAIGRMGGQFVLGQTIAQALQSSREPETRGYTYSYDMLGEAALTAEDAARYFDDYSAAIDAIGNQAQGASLYARPGISIKLSALHPRYARAQKARVMGELLPRLKSLAAQARHHDIGLNIDAEESDRLDLSLDLLEALCHMPELARWNGIGFVVQAYGKRASHVVDYLIELARQTKHRLMVRLVKGAYWDTEIKRTQVEGVDDFPVFTRKCHTDVSYLACARRLLAAKEEIYPQFATHNAHTIAAIHAMAGPHQPGKYEFQCLHGMGQAVYGPVIDPAGLATPCRIYAPVGAHRALLCYLVRRLLENGANSSFVNQAANPEISLDELIRDPVSLARKVSPLGAPHADIRLPEKIFGPSRRNSQGLDLTDECMLETLDKSLRETDHTYISRPLIAHYDASGDATRPVINPADHRDIVGQVTYASDAAIEKALGNADQEATWSKMTPAARRDILDKCADALEAHMIELIALLVREAGKTYANAVGEVREAVDFLRYYGAQVATKDSEATITPLGIILCISPWNFPLAIFTGQIAASLAAGNAVIAKPAEETPLIAAMAVRLFHESGVPLPALQLLPGDGDVGAALVADKRIDGVMFTGSTKVGKLISGVLLGRRGRTGQPVSFIAETGGQNAMLVDSSSLPEQAVTDIIASAFDSAGQRCSALRVLLVQDDCAEHVIDMLKGALDEISVGDPSQLSTDIGPVISEEAKSRIEDHIAAMRDAGRVIWQPKNGLVQQAGWFVPPTIIEVGRVADIGQEVFGPVLHVRRFERQELSSVIDAVNATGYALTFGIQSRVKSTIQHATSRSHAGNIYVNRNIIGATVGSQPFGGRAFPARGRRRGAAPRATARPVR
ncbi:bifunctional proline dehydrogenase/L-glutamate gamma-semialdehyde dehydrogenase PutA [Sorlinia euscelidii]|uniref:Bifunctional protein PutA n=1 Tax=Sorlinia euscelidii TaxID=3081148 RepID=A0ABU7U315_9PROT